MTHIDHNAFVKVRNNRKSREYVIKNNVMGIQTLLVLSVVTLLMIIFQDKLPISQSAMGWIYGICGISVLCTMYCIAFYNGYTKGAQDAQKSS